METREQLARRVQELERQVAVLKAGSPRIRQGIRKRAAWGLGSIPLYDIALGPDLERGELRGHARGLLAVGDVATGVIAVGGLARGVFALGGLAAGVISFGGFSLGLLVALGGLAIGSLAVGGAAVGGVAVGGAGLGHYACGGGCAGRHVVSPLRADPEALAFFERHGLGDVCRPRRHPR